MPLKHFAGVLFCTIISLCCYAQGSLTDNSFGTNGMVRPRLDRKPVYNDLFVDKKNRLMYTLDTVLPGGDKAIAIKRFNSSGQPDLTFNGTGTLVVNQQPGNSGIFDYEFISNILFLSDHKITFSVYSETDETWFRLNENGTPDAGFGVAGKRPLPPEFDLDLTAVTNDDKFISVRPDDLVSTLLFIRRFTNAGNADISFGTNCIVVVDLQALGSSMQYPNEILIDNNNKTLIIGAGDFGMSLCILRLQQNGAVDPSFNTGGFMEYSAQSDANEPYLFFGGQLTADGKLLFTGADEISSSAILRIGR